jgi:hypothetical protein
MNIGLHSTNPDGKPMLLEGSDINSVFWDKHLQTQKSKLTESSLHAGIEEEEEQTDDFESGVSPRFSLYIGLQKLRT